MDEREKVRLLYDNACTFKKANGCWDMDKIHQAALELGIRKQNGEPYPHASLRALMSKGGAAKRGITPKSWKKKAEKTAKSRKPSIMKHIKQIMDSDLPSDTKLKVITDCLAASQRI